MLLADLAATSLTVATTASRRAKVDTIAACLRRAEPGEVPIAVAYLSGELRQRRPGVGWAALRDGAPPPAGHSQLTLAEVDEAFGRMEAATGAGAVAVRQTALAALLGRGTDDEQRFLVQLVSGNLRQGALAGVMAEAVARAAGAAPAAVRRAAMFSGDLAAVARVALAEGPAGLNAFRLQVGRPLQPMLAQSAPTVEAAWERTVPAVVEWKLDGVRIQAHRDGTDVAVFSRTLDDITGRVPEVVEAVLALPVQQAVFDGEVIALRPDGRPRPFQETAARVARRTVESGQGPTAALSAVLFDVLHLDGEDLLDRALAERYGAVETRLPPGLWVRRLVPSDADGALSFYRDAVAQGHEGVVVKALGSVYEAGRRGSGWVKAKPRHTLDLVVLAAEWGHGRRRGWLSNLHLGARDPAAGGFVMLGKTFKGLTDALLEWQTGRLLALETGRDPWTVRVRPELVVEVAFDGVQASPRYAGGVALRFARVLRYRPDKPAAEADTVEAVRSLREAGS